MNYPNEIRNKAIVYLRKLDKETFTLPALAEMFNRSKQNLHNIEKRDWNKYHLPKIKGQ